METTGRSLRWGLIGLLAGVIVIVIVVIALRSGGEAPETASLPAAPGATQEAAASVVAQEAGRELAQEATDTPEAVTDADPVSTPAQEGEFLTEDDRSQRLKAVTSTWNTNWNKHTVRYDEILSGGPPRDGIPSIDEPKFISPVEAADWLADNEPVILLEINGDARAYPLQILIWHEIVNDEVGGVPVAVTFCPLCNAAITFDRRFNGQVFEFGTSGLLRNSDLIMYDRTTETLWQQFTGEGIVGDLAGEQLTFIPSSLIGFADFRSAYPDGVVLSQDTGFSRSYGRNPYAGYDNIDQNPFLFDAIPDERLPAMARVVTVVLDEVAVAYPLTTLAETGVIHDTQGGQDLVVFHIPGTVSALDASSIVNSRDVGATGVFDPNLEGQKLTFTRQDKVFIDDQTGSVWNIVGHAVEGPLAGKQLTPILHADHFWFSWAAFQPDTIIYSPS